MSAIYEKEARGTLEGIGKRLEEAVKARKFGVISVVDLQAKMKEKGVAFANPCRVYEVCNPQQAKLVLEGDMRVSTVLPCRISVYSEAGRVKLATMLPTEMLRVFNLPALVPVARDVEIQIKAMIDEAAAS